jgi:hypothetical protein
MDLIKRTLSLSVIFVLALLCCNMNNVFAATYYVSPDGTNTWPNCTSSENPCPASGTNKEFLGARAGDTVYFLPGTYDPGNAPSWEVPAWNPTNSGSSGNLITFKAYNNATCLILKNDIGPSIGSNGRDWIVWDGFSGKKGDVTNTFVRFANNTHCTIQNCDFTGSSVTVSINVPVFVHTVSYFTMRNCKLHGSLGPDTTNSTGFMSYYMTNSTIEHNEFYNNRVGYRDKVCATNNTIRYNFFHSGGGYWLDAAGTGGSSHHIYIYQNVILNSKIYIGLDAFSGSYVYIYNNTIYNGGDAIVTEGQAVDIIEVFNNIIHTATRGIHLYSTTTNRYFDYNNVYTYTYWGSLGANDYSLANWRTALGGCPGTGRECNGVTTNPNFVNAGGNFVTDYKRTSYPATGRGGSYPNVTGAYITGNEIIGCGAGSIVPKSPTGLRIIP